MGSRPSPRHRARAGRLPVLVALLGLTALAGSTTSALADEQAPPGGGSGPVGERPTGDVTRFTVATFNVLGHRHTAKGGKKASWPSGVKRMGTTLRLLRRHDVDVVGFQELQPEQLWAFNQATGPGWSLYPGNHLTQYAMHNSLAWDNRVWTLVHASAIPIPYLHGVRVPMPVVKLKHNRTGQRVYFANFHNPADSKGPAQRWRDRARAKQIRLAREIHELGVPLVLTGDMNERERYFCAMTTKAPMHAANGGHTRKGRCQPPEATYIDWIFGSRRVEFGSFTKVTRDELVKVSDHPFLAATARIDKRRR